MCVLGESRSLTGSAQRITNENGVKLGLVTEDVAGAYARAVDAGATPLKEPAEKPWGQTVGYVRDLNGVLIEICSPMG